MVEHDHDHHSHRHLETRQKILEFDHGERGRSTITLPFPPILRKLPHHIWLLPRKSIVALIALYQATLSPDHGPLRHLWHYGYCRHSPTCSEYGRRVITERGAIVGSLLLLKRLLSCHPWKQPSPERIMEVSHGDL
ncbi:MAG: membrane protein insertion efficiency factor YidD [Candidatus Peribacteraceae bacterium]|nr:membrane protein insertion efficiency factor YidD [Candidatus Peribacteraceae bacterium]